MRYFATSDLHLGHGNIIHFCNRPFKNPTDMNEKLINNWNMRVREEDTIFHVGDFCFRANKTVADELGVGKEKAEHWYKQLNGNIIFIKGNHDRNNSLKTYIDSVYVTYAGRSIKLVHKPEDADPNVDINLVGHVHEKWRIRTFEQHYLVIASAVSVIGSDRKDWGNFLLKHTDNCYKQSILLNVGVDVQKYQPITFDEALYQVNKFKAELRDPARREGGGLAELDHDTFTNPGGGNGD